MAKQAPKAPQAEQPVEAPKDDPRIRYVGDGARKNPYKPGPNVLSAIVYSTGTIVETFK